MTIFQALLLGIVQGVTEFFPISSSAHLRLFKWLLGIPDGEQLLYFDLLCHAGTLFALIIYLRKEIGRVFASKHQMALFTVALLPLIPGYFLLKPLRMALSDPSYLGYFLLLTGILLFAATKKRTSQVQLASTPFSAEIPDTKRQFLTQKWKDVLWIGMMQTMALIPGISRSGATIATARFCGWNWVQAAQFSFLLAVPTIVGGEFLETIKLIKGSSEAMGVVSPVSYGVGFIASFCTGCFAVRSVFWIYQKARVRPFAWYCFGFGLLTLAIFHG